MGRAGQETTRHETERDKAAGQPKAGQSRAGQRDRVQRSGDPAEPGTGPGDLPEVPVDLRPELVNRRLGRLTRSVDRYDRDVIAIPVECLAFSRSTLFFRVAELEGNVHDVDRLRGARIHRRAQDTNSERPEQERIPRLLVASRGVSRVTQWRRFLPLRVWNDRWLGYSIVE